MATSASVRPPCARGAYASSPSPVRDDTVLQREAWILTAAEMALAPAASPLAPERTGFTEWRFGDLTLIQEIMGPGQDTGGFLRSRRARRGACVVLVRDEAQPVPMLVVSPRASLAMAALARPAQRAGTRREVLILFMPGEVLGSAEGEAIAPVRHLDAAAGPGALLASFLRGLAAEASQMQGEQARLLSSATRALIAACIAPPCGPDASALPLPACGTVERARLMVQRHMACPDFGPPQLARLLAMSRSKLYRMLDGDGGVAHFINRERLLQAWRDLAAPGDALSVHAIATQVGFRDHSTFSRAFRRAFGCSPTQARERALLTDPSEPAFSARQAARPGEGGACRACGAPRENGMNGPDLGF